MGELGSILATMTNLDNTDEEVSHITADDQLIKLIRWLTVVIDDDIISHVVEEIISEYESLNKWYAQEENMSIRSDIVDALDNVEDEITGVEDIIKSAIQCFRNGDFEDLEVELEEALKIVTELLKELY